MLISVCQPLDVSVSVLRSHSAEIAGTGIDHPEMWPTGFDLKQISWELTGKTWLNLWALLSHMCACSALSDTKCKRSGWEFLEEGECLSESAGALC